MGRVLQYGAIVAAFLLILVAVAGPIYAFLLMSCVSTLPCQIGSLIHTLGVSCEEGDIEELLHGEKCTVDCGKPGYAASTPELVCVDGVAAGFQDLKCRPIPVFVAPRAGGLVSGAVTEGELRTACYRARFLTCEATPGGTALLLSLPNVSQAKCSDLLEECRDLNPAFAFGQSTRYPEPNEAGLGVCSLGCYVSALSENGGAPDLPTPEPNYSAFGKPPPSYSNEKNCAGPDDQPICVHVNDSCNPGDNSDYYRYPTCAANQRQWVQLDGSHRIRYDGEPQYSQGGKWIIESGADPKTDERGVELARQNTLLSDHPVFGVYQWNAQCQVKVDPVTWMAIFRKIELNISLCVCDDFLDCSGNGKAVGSKVSGPNCFCECFKGFYGQKCEGKLCTSVGVVNAPLVPCAEGKYIPAGGVCTPLCDAGFVPSEELFYCADDASGIQPVFTCNKIKVSINDPSEEEFGIVRATPPPDCAPLDCSFRGEPTGKRRSDGSCICNCGQNFTGPQCMSWQGGCMAPLAASITHSARSPCGEGAMVPTLCTARCVAGYFPVPSSLTCMGSELVPASFGCYGGPDTRETWCQVMKHLSLGATGVAAFCLLIGCVWRSKPFERIFDNFITRANVVMEVVKDEDGNKFHVVRAEMREDFGGLPKRVRGRIHAVQDQMEVDRLNIEEGKLSSSTLLELQDAKDLMATTGSSYLHLIRCTQGEDQLISPVCFSEQTNNSTLRDLADAYGQGELGHMSLEDADAALPPGQIADVNEDQLALGAEASQMQAERTMSLAGTLTRGGGTGSRVGSPKKRKIHTVPENSFDVDWCKKALALEEQSLAERREREQKMKEAANRGAAEAAASIKFILESTAEERAAVDAAMRAAFKAGDGEALRSACQMARVTLQKLSACPPAATASLVRLLKIAECRVAQYEDREEARQSKRDHEDRIFRGEAPDWSMTPEDLWRYVEECNVARVRGGMRAKLPVLTKSKDGNRFTVLHVAVRSACKEGAETSSAQRLAVVEELLKAHANPNAIDAKSRTPLDLALSEGGLNSGDLPVVVELRKLGLLTATEAAEAATTASRTSHSMTSRTTSSAETDSSAVEKASPTSFRPRVTRSFV